MAVNITFLAGYYEPDVSADTHLNSSLCNGLAQNGYNVTVVAPFPSRGISDELKMKYLELDAETNGYGVNIVRTGKSNFRKNIMLRGIDFIKKSILLYKTAKEIKTDVYIITSTPPFLGLISNFLPKNAIKIYRLQDIFPDNLVHAGLIKKGSFIFNFFKYLEPYLYAKNDLIVTISQDMKQQLIRRGVNPEKIKVVYNWIDENTCVSIKKEDNFLFDEFKIDRTKFNVVYAGNIGVLQNVETIVKAAEYLKSQENIRFIIVGDGVLKNEIRENITNKSLKNIHIFPMQPLEKVSYVYSLGDIGLVSLKPNVSKSAMPSKTWSIMSTGRPVVCEIDADSELNEIITVNKCGVCIKPNDYVGMAHEIFKLYQNSKLLDEAGQNARKYIVEHIGEKSGINNFIKCVDRYSCRKVDADV